MQTRPPFTCVGGKYRLAPLIAELLPSRHERPILVEVFGGLCALTFSLQPPWPFEVVNDVDDGIVGFLRCLRDHHEELVNRLRLTPHSRSEWQTCRETWSAEKDPIERARRWFVVAAQSFSGIFAGSWGFSTCSSGGWYTRTWCSRIDHLILPSARLRRVQIERKDWREVLVMYDGPQSILYLDPPYTPDTRAAGSQTLYGHEMTAIDHDELLARVQKCQSVVILSGYRNNAYDAALVGWRRIDINVGCQSIARTKAAGRKGAGSCADARRTESLWLSPNCRPERQLTLPIPAPAVSASDSREEPDNASQ